MSEDLGKITSVNFKVLITPEIDKIFHKGFKGILTVNNDQYNLKVKSRYTKNGEISIKGEIND